jgi:actin
MNINETAKILEINSPFGKEEDQKSRVKKHKTKNVKNENIIDEKNMLGFLNNKMNEMETEYDLEEHLIIDIGHAYTKVGFSGEDLPFLTVPSIYSTLKETTNRNEITFEAKHLYGYEHLKSKSKNLYNVKHLNAGCHKTMMDSEFADFLRVQIESKLEHKTIGDFYVVINTSPIKNKENIIRLGKMFLEDFVCKGVAMMNSSSLSLFSTGRTSGVVVECGEKRSYTIPIFEGYPIYHGLNKNKIGGKHLTEIIAKGIEEAGLPVEMDDISTIRKIKDKMLSVPYQKDINHYLYTDNDIMEEARSLYKLPDKNIIKIPKNSRLIASEMLFTPFIAGYPDKGLVPLLADSIKKTVLDNEETKKVIFILI